MFSLRTILVTCAALASCGENVPSLPLLGAGDVVLAFGDSLTYGTGAQIGESYPEVLSGLIGHKVIGAGVPGEQTAGGLERIDELIETYRPKIMLLCLGGNDMLRKVAQNVIDANLRRLVEKARNKGVAVLLIGVPEPVLFGGTAEYYERIAEDFELPLEGNVLNDILKNDEYKSDPIHPNALGYRILAEAIAALLRDAGAISK